MRPGYPDRRVQVSDGVYPYVYIVYITCRAPGSTRPPYTTIYKSQRVFAPTCISVCATCRAPGLAIDLLFSRKPPLPRPPCARDIQTAECKSQTVFTPTCMSYIQPCRAPGTTRPPVQLYTSRRGCLPLRVYLYMRRVERPV